jgi:hypothetical protein
MILRVLSAGQLTFFLPLAILLMVHSYYHD